ncbi:MAG: lipoyl protein ligase domain-containing protein [Candidatus Woesearchaeota archaeon]
MNSELEFKVFYDEAARKPSENMAVNEYFRKMIEGNACSFVARIYKNSKGVILGTNQSIEDINLDYCLENNYEILRRETEGGALVLDEDSVLSYSLFFRKSINNHASPTDYCKLFLLALTKNLNETQKGKNSEKLEFTVNGDYYIKYSKNNGSCLKKEEIPLQRHFFYEKDYVIELDAYVNVKKPNVDTISKILKLRELYSKNGNKIILAGNEVYDLKGNKLDISPEELRNNYSLKRSEIKELGIMEGLEELSIKEEFLNALLKTFKETFNTEIVRDERNIFYFDYSINTNAFNINSDFLERNLGHSFVDLLCQEKPFRKNNKNHNKNRKTLCKK